MASMDHNKIVILDANHERRNYLRWMITDWGYRPFIFEKETNFLDNLDPLKPDLLITGAHHPEKVFRLIHTIALNHKGLPVLIISGNPMVRDFINTNGFNGVSVIRSDFDPLQFKNRMDSALSYRGKDDNHPQKPIVVGNTAEIRKIKKMIPGLDCLTDPILIQGEPGTGKELIARSIHSSSVRSNQSFIKVNVAELATKMFETEIFGNVSGNFSEAVANRSGIFSVADRGTVFFDEVGSISPGFQAKLLRLFEDCDAFKSDQPGCEIFDFRIIVATSVPLEKYVAKGDFRKDLYYRLNAIRIDLPALRDRKDDIPLLADFFADKYCLQIKCGHFELSSEIKHLFSHYSWPGNVRELESLVKNVVSLGTENTVIKQFKQELEQVSKPVSSSKFDDINALVPPEDITRLTKDINRLSLKEIGQEIMEQAEKSILKKVLENTRWNRKKAARMLSISYKSLLNKIKAYELS